MKAKKKLSESEIKQKLIDDSDNPAAWDEPITVLPSKAPRPKWYSRSKNISREVTHSTRRRKAANGKTGIATDKSRAA
jgi:hypothetical protein